MKNIKRLCLVIILFSVLFSACKKENAYAKSIYVIKEIDTMSPKFGIMCSLYDEAKYIENNSFCHDYFCTEIDDDYCKSFIIRCIFAQKTPIISINLPTDFKKIILFSNVLKKFDIPIYINIFSSENNYSQYEKAVEILKKSNGNIKIICSFDIENQKDNFDCDFNGIFYKENSIYESIEQFEKINTLLSNEEETYFLFFGAENKYKNTYKTFEAAEFASYFYKTYSHLPNVEAIVYLNIENNIRSYKINSAEFLKVYKTLADI